MLFINIFNLWTLLLIIGQASAVSFNQPKFSSNSSWNPNATTVANITTIGSSPYDIFINTNNTIYVPNQDTGQIIVWSEGNLTSTKNISGNLLNSSSLFVTTTGDMYVDSFHTIGGITQITLNLTIHIPTMNICQQCWDLFININNILYCSLSERHQIITKSLNNDSSLLKIVGGTGSAGSASATLNNPRGIFVDNNLNLYVADSGNDRIQLFPSGKLSATTIAGNGSSYITITLNWPTSIILDGNDYLYIVDSGNHRIVGSDASGFRCIIGCSGSSGLASHQLYDPWAISFDSYGNIFVTDQGNNRIQQFTVLTELCVTTTSTTGAIATGAQNYATQLIGNGYHGIQKIRYYSATNTGSTMRFGYPIVYLNGTTFSGSYVNNAWYALHAGCGNSNGIADCTGVCKAISKTYVSITSSCGAGYIGSVTTYVSPDCCVYTSADNVTTPWNDYGAASTCNNPMIYCDCTL